MQKEIERLNSSNIRSFAIILILTLVLLLSSFHSGMNNQQDNTLRDYDYEFSSQIDTGISDQLIKDLSIIDTDQNRIHDDLDDKLQKINQFSVNNEKLQLIFLMKDSKFSSDIQLLEGMNIEITQLWDGNELISGGVITVESNLVYQLVDLFSDKLILIEEDQQLSTHSDVASKITGLRNRVWDTLGYTGNLNMSIAVLDSGIDATHLAFGDGAAFGDLDLSKKIIGWHDATTDGYTNPVDIDGHGSHVAGIIGSNPYNSSQSNPNNIDYTKTFEFAPETATDIKNSTYTINVQSTGTLEVDLSSEKFENGPAAGHIQKAFLFDPYDRLVDSYTDGAKQDGTRTLTGSVSNVSAFGDWSVIFEYILESGQYIVVKTVNKVPYELASDNHGRISGVAPDINLVSVRIFNDTGIGGAVELINGLNWISANKETYNITIMSGSFGFNTTVASVDTAISNLVNEGVLGVFSAGNDGQTGNNEIHSPSHVDNVITVGATDDNDELTFYSSEGSGLGNTTKPDLVGPGGDPSTGGILNVDTNGGDGFISSYGAGSEAYANDLTPLSGTSMSTPLVAGVAGLVIEALGGMDFWTYNSSVDVLKIKQLLLMTTHEIYQDDDGGKNKFEGYGRINPVAALQAATQVYNLGSQVSSTLSSNLEDEQVWAASINLNADTDYLFNLNVPSGYDLDLFLYSPNPDSNGEPVIIQKSTTTGDSSESLTVSTTSGGSYYIIVKAAFQASGSGSFTLTSSQTGGVLDETPPSIIGPEDFLIPYGIPGNTISWELGDKSPGFYSVYQNDSLVEGPTGWTNGTVQINIDNLDQNMVYNYTLVVSDLTGNSAFDVVLVTVISESTLPSVSSPDDITYPLNSFGNIISWEVGDQFPTTYDITIDDVSIVSNQNWGNGTITQDIDGLGFGDHNITIYLFDIFGNTNNASSLIHVVEEDTIAPTVVSNGDLTYQFGATDQEIGWAVSDDFPGFYDIHENDSILVENERWVSGDLTYNVSGLDLGEYNFTLYLSDSSGNEVVSSIIVSVVSSIDNGGADGLDLNVGLIVGIVAALVVAGGTIAFRILRPEQFEGVVTGSRERLGDLYQSSRERVSDLGNQIRNKYDDFRSNSENNE